MPAVLAGMDAFHDPWPVTEADARAVPERLRRPTGFPYIPGLLSFHEAPAILSVWR